MLEYILKFMHAVYIPYYPYLHLLACSQTYIPTYIPTYLHAYTYTHAHVDTFIITCLHTYMCIYIYIYISACVYIHRTKKYMFGIMFFIFLLYLVTWLHTSKKHTNTPGHLESFLWSSQSLQFPHNGRRDQPRQVKWPWTSTSRGGCNVSRCQKTWWIHRHRLHAGRHKPGYLQHDETWYLT